MDYDIHPSFDIQFPFIQYVCLEQKYRRGRKKRMKKKEKNEKGVRPEQHPKNYILICQRPKYKSTRDLLFLFGLLSVVLDGFCC